MSRIGNLPVAIVKGVTVTLDGKTVAFHGPKGELTIHVPTDIAVEKQQETLVVTQKHDAKGLHQTVRPKGIRALHGFFRATISNAMHGVSEGWTKTLELSGVGYRANISGASLVLTVGFSHPVTIVPPSGVNFAIVDGKVVVSGIDRQVVGQVAATVRAVKPPEPYKGKGIKYLGEYIRKKAGKSAKAVGGSVSAAK